MEDRIQIVFGLHDKTGQYIANVARVIASILDNTASSIDFHVITDDSVSRDNRDKLAGMTEATDSRVIYHHIDPSKIDIENSWVDYYSIGSLYRLFSPEILYDIDKVIYLDADVICLRDIAKLWAVDMSQHALAGCHDIGFDRGYVRPRIILEGSVEQAKYVNSGVLLMNLARIRAKGNLYNMTNDFIREYSDTFLPDQDALNYIFRDEIMILDPTWNCYTRFERTTTNALNPYLYHFMGQSPNNSELTEYDKKYYHYQGMTPWGLELLERDMYNAMFVAYDKIDQLQKVMCKVAARDITIVYYGFGSGAMNQIRDMMGDRDNTLAVGEFVSDAEGKWRKANVLDYDSFLATKRDDVCILVIPEADNSKAMDRLSAAGYINGESFFVVPRILVAKQGGYWG